MAALALALSFRRWHKCEKLLRVRQRGEFAPQSTNVEVAGGTIDGAVERWQVRRQ